MERSGELGELLAREEGKPRAEGVGEVFREVFVELGLMEDPDSDEELEDMEKIAEYFSAGVREDVVFDFAGDTTRPMSERR